LETYDLQNTVGLIKQSLVYFLSFIIEIYIRCASLIAYGVCPIVLYHLAIALSVVLRFTISVDPFGIFKLIRPLQEELEDTKGESEFANDTMVKRESTIGQATIYKT